MNPGTPPWGGGPGNPWQPQPPQPQFPPYRPAPPPRPPGGLSTALKIRLGILGCGLVLGAGTFVATMLGARRRTLTVDNANDFDVSVSIDGKPAGTVRAHGHHRFAVEPGQHTLVAQNPAGAAEQNAFTVVPNARGGYRGLYNVAGRGRYAVVTMTYGPGPRQPTVPVSPGVPVFEIPDGVEVNSDLDDTFPDRLPTRGGTTRITHLCHVSDDGSIPCAGSR